jgi:hypothetical protein
MQAIGVTPLRIIVWEMHPQIAFAECAEYRVSNSMQQRVSIGVALATSVRVYVNSSEDQRATLNQPVRVVADANSEHSGLRKPFRLDRALVPAGRTSPRSKRLTIYD